MTVARQWRPTARQLRFVELFCGGERGNGARSAKGAGYKGGPAQLAAVAGRLLKNVNIRALIAEAEAETRSDRIATREELCAFFTSVVRGDERTADAMGEETPASMRDRLKAGELLAKMGGFFLEKREVKVDVQATRVFFPADGRGPAPR